MQFIGGARRQVPLDRDASQGDPSRTQGLADNGLDITDSTGADVDGSSEDVGAQDNIGVPQGPSEASEGEEPPEKRARSSVSPTTTTSSSCSSPRELGGASAALLGGQDAMKSGDEQDQRGSRNSETGPTLAAVRQDEYDELQLRKSSFEGRIRVAGVVIENNAVLDLVLEDAVAGIQAASRVGGWAVWTRELTKRRTRIKCAKGTPFKSRAKGGSKKTGDAKRKRSTKVRASGRSDDPAKCCAWEVNLMRHRESPATKTIVVSYNGDHHNHLPVDNSSSKMKARDATAKMVEVATSLSKLMSNAEIAAVLQEKADRSHAKGDRPLGVIFAKTIASLAKTGETDSSVAVAIRELLKVKHDNVVVLWVEDEQGSLVTLCDLDDAKVTESLQAAQARTDGQRQATQRTSRSAARNPDDRQHAADHLVAIGSELQRAIAASTRTERAQVGVGEQSSGKGRGNHGAAKDSPYDEFRYDGVPYRLHCAAWISRRQIARVRRCPWVLVFDVTFGTNKRRRPLFDGVAVNGENQNELVIQVFMLDERRSTFEWIFVTAIPKIYGDAFCRLVQLIILDGCVTAQDALALAIMLVFTKASLRECGYHLIKQPLDDISTRHSAKLVQQVKKDVTTLVWSATCCLTRSEGTDLLTLAHSAVCQVRNERSFVQAMTSFLSNMRVKYQKWAGSSFVDQFTLLHRVGSRSEC
jgi:MULE transposase domain